MYERAIMKYIRINDPLARTVTTAFVSSHPPRFDAATEGTVSWEPADHYCIYAVRGRRDISGSGFDYTVSGETIRFYFKGHRYVMDPRQRYEEIAIAFSSHQGDAVCSEIDARDSSIHLPLISTVSGNPVPKQLCRQILLLSASSSTADTMRRNALLQMLFAEIIGSSGAYQNADHAIKRVIHELERNIKSAPDIDMLARTARMSRRTLVRNFRSATGKTIMQFLLTRRIEIARAMLTGDPSLTAGEIASQLGFYDEYHFGHTFKKITGISPKRSSRTGTPER